MRITEFAKQTGASADELRYMDMKGFIKSERIRLKQREVRQYHESDIRRVQLIIRYRRQGFTWDAAYQRALRELENPLLFE